MVSSTSFSESSSRAPISRRHRGRRFDFHDIQVDVQRRQFLPDKVVQLVGQHPPLGLLHFDQPARDLGGFELLVLMRDQPRLSIAGVRCDHPDVEQRCDEQQFHDVEHAVDEECLLQRERALRNLDGVHSERRDREQCRQAPEQSAAAGGPDEQQGEAKDRGNVQFDPCDDIYGDETERNGEHRHEERRSLIK